MTDQIIELVEDVELLRKAEQLIRLYKQEVELKDATIKSLTADNLLLSAQVAERDQVITVLRERIADLEENESKNQWWHQQNEDDQEWT